MAAYKCTCMQGYLLWSRAWYRWRPGPNGCPTAFGVVQDRGLLETNPLPSFASLLKGYRVSRGLSQETLAERAGLSRGAISLLERGMRLSPRRDTLNLLAKTLKLSADERARLLAAVSKQRSRAGPAPQSEAGPASSLPVRLTGFIGREREIAEVQVLLLARRLVTLTGPGGIGKTTLALVVAAAVQAHFADGVALVDLVGLTDGESVPRAVAAVLGVRERPGEPILTTLGSAVGMTQRLLMLDNCEHLLPSCARTIEALLQECPRLCILVTSREPLRVGAEVVRRVPSLTLPESYTRSVDEVARSEAVRLFVERAGAVRPGFSLSAGNAAQVTEICRRLDGIPLAIELAAARVAALTPAQIAQRLNDRFRLLTTGSRTAVPRHQTLRALIDWSHDLLSEREQVLFRRLAVFVGGWNLGAAEAVCTDGGPGTEYTEAVLGPSSAVEDVLDLLTGLVDKSLVLVEERDSEARFAMLETIREYARERLAASGEASDLQQRHARWALALAESARPAIMTEEKLQRWLARLGQEDANLRAALRWFREALDVTAALRLAGALWLYWVIRDDYAEGKVQVEAVLALPGVTHYPAELAAVRRGAGHMAFGLGDLPTARSHFGAAVDYYRNGGDPGAFGEALMWLGAVAREQGDFASALPWLEAALDIGRDMANDELIAFALYHLGGARSDQGDRVRARSLLEESVALYRKSGLTERLATQSLSLLGFVVEDMGDDARASSLYREALTYLGRVEDRMNIAFLLEGFASLAAKASQPSRALRLIGGANRLREEIGSPLAVVSSRRHSRTIALARQELLPEVADAALAAGRSMTVQEAVAYALAERHLESPV